MSIAINKKKPFRLVNGDFVLPFEVEEKSLAKGQVVTHYGYLEDKLLFLGEGVVQINTLKVKRREYWNLFSRVNFSAHILPSYCKNLQMFK